MIGLAERAAPHAEAPARVPAGPRARWTGYATSALLPAAGGAAGWLAWRLLPLPGDDPLRGTLAAVPAVLAGFAAVDRAARRRGAARLPREWVRLELAALAALILAALARGTVGLGEATPALAAGLLGLAGLHAGLQLRALRPLLGDRLPQRPSALFFAVPAILFLATLPWAAERRQPDGDEPYYLLVAHSLAYDLDTDLADEYAAGAWRYFVDRPLRPQLGDPRGDGGEVYSRHNVLLPSLLALPYRLAGKAGALAAMALLAAALPWLTLRLAGRYFPGHPGEALLACGLLAVAPPLLCYAHQVWVEVPAAVLLALGLDGVAFLPAARERSRLRRALAWLALALPLVLLPLLKIRFALLAAPLLALAFHRDGRSRRGLLALTALLAATAAGVLLFNQMRYGNALKVHRWHELALPAMSLQGTVEGFLGLFWDAAFGLFAFAPLWLLVVPALALGAVRRSAAAGHLALIALPYLLLLAPRAEWYGGWSPPFRYGVVFLPLLALVLVPLLVERRRPGARLVLGVLGAATLVLALVWVAAPGATFHLAHGRTRILDLLSNDLAADAARLFPSFVRPRLATWLWPAASAALVTLAWWLPRERRDGAAAATPLLAGVALFLCAAAAVPVAASLLPTRVVEPEDPWLVHRGGHVHPETWVITRSHYRGGWVLRPGEALEVPLVAPGGGGSARASLAVELYVGRHNPDPLALEVLSGEEPVAAWRAGRPGGWRRVELGAVELPAGRPLVLRAAGPPRPGRANTLVLDRVEVAWR